MVTKEELEKENEEFISMVLKVVKLEQYIEEFQEQYEYLVWYARKPDYDNEYWNEIPSGTPAAVHKANNEAVFEVMRGVEARFPEEVKDLSSPSTGDFEHGFNSGCLAAFRFVQTALEDERIEIDEDTGEEYSFGGLQNTIDVFPDLNT